MKGNFNFQYLGIFFISTATLFLEISLTRIFSVSQWYHFAFMIISISFLGFGAAGAFLSIKRSLLKKNYQRNLSLFSLIFSFSLIISFILTQKIPFDPFQILWDKQQLFYISLYYLLLGIPFFFSGLCICLVLSKIPKKVSKVYGFNLVGSGLGCLLVIFLFQLGSSSVILSASFLGFLSSLSFTFPYSRKIFVSFVIGFSLFLILFSTTTFLEVRISPYKTLPQLLNYPQAKILLTRWNSFSRVDVIESKGVRYAPGLSYQYQEILPPQLGVTIDGNSLNAITKFEPEKLEFLNFLPQSLAYQFQKNPKVLIISPGGSLDVLLALQKNSSFIEVSEPNPIMRELISHDFKEFSGNLYGREQVRVKIEEARSVIRKNNNYDLIIISLGGDPGKASTGIYGLNENYLFTSEAFQDFYSHLSEDGFLVVTRWIHHPPREGVRVVSLAEDALENLEVKAEDRIIIIRGYVTLTLFLKKNLISPEEREKLKEFSQEKRFDLVYYPGIKAREVNLYHQFPEPYFYQLSQEILLGKKEKLYSEYLLDIRPSSDEQPYFFNYFRLDKLKELYKSLGKKWEPFFEGGFLVWIVFIQAFILSIMLLFLPLGLFKKIKISSKNFSILGYFLCLGLGYMLVEIVLIQKFTLFLGQPLFSISLIIFSLLVFSGVGSLFSERLKIRTLKRVIPLLGGLILLYLLLLPQIFNHFLGQVVEERALLSIFLLLPLGFLMGLPFPLGIKILEKENKKLIPWAFSGNTLTSVMGSVLAILLALELGFSWVLIFAAGVYLSGLGMIFKYSH